MHFFKWGTIQIPLVFVTGLSMKKTAKVVERSGGFITSRGFETSEISAQIEVTRERCLAAGTDFNYWYSEIDNLAIERGGKSGVVTLGGYPLYPELKFALTNKNTTRIADLVTNAPTSIACDIVLSGVECVKEVVRQRTLENSAQTLPVPKISLTVDGKTLVLQDGTRVSKLNVTPNSCEVTIQLGSDASDVNRDAFLSSLVDEKKATITLDLPLGQSTYHIIWADLNDGILQIVGSIFTETANQTITKTFEDCDVREIIQFLGDALGVKSEIRIDGHVDYFRLNGTPVDALEALQKSVGFVVSVHAGIVTFAFLPDNVEAQKTLEGLIVEEDEMDEVTSGVVWRDGENEFVVGDKSGEILKVDSVLRTTNKAFARECLKMARFKTHTLVVSGDIDAGIRHHSQVGISKDSGVVVGVVDYYIFDYVSNVMRLEVRQVDE